MITAVQIVVSLAPFVLAGAWPFARVARGGSVLGSLFLCWLLLILWHFVFILVLPLAFSAISRELGRAVSDWVPEGPAITVITLSGWFYAAVIVFVADCVRYFVSKPKSPDPA